MITANRRQFLKQTSTVIAGAALGMGGSRAAGANERIILGMIGPGGQGSSLLSSFAAQKDAEVAYVCDADSSRMSAAAQAVDKATGRVPKAVKDMRAIFDDRTVDAVIIATPDHWHAPATILACDAGKHVYVEKPCAHNIREGRLMIEAARRNNRVVQVDTQTVIFEYVGVGTRGSKHLIYEQRIWSPYVQEGYENGNASFSIKSLRW